MLYQPRRRMKGKYHVRILSILQAKYEIEQEHIGISIECVFCSKSFVIQEYQQENNNTIQLNSNHQEETMKEYKVLTQKDKWFSQKFDPEVLEKALNSYASQGWKVVSAVTATFPGFIGGNREEMVVILERDK